MRRFGCRDNGRIPGVPVAKRMNLSLRGTLQVFESTSHFGAPRAFGVRALACSERPRHPKGRTPNAANAVKRELLGFRVFEAWLRQRRGGGVKSLRVW